MAKPWAEVEQSEAYRQLPGEEQAAAKKQYFDQVVAPQVPEAERGAAWSQFEAYQVPGRSNTQELGRQIGLTGRHLAEGAASTVGIVADPIGATISKITGKPYRPLSQYVSGLLTSAGAPEPETATERVIGDASRAVASGGAMFRGAQAAQQLPGTMAKAAGNLLTQAPKQQLASMVTGAGAGGTARESGASEGTQIVAGLAGGLVPSGAAMVGAEGLRRSLRGGEQGRQRVAENIDAFEAAGAQPSVGQATESRAARGIETLLTRTPGGSGVMAKAAERQADNIGGRVNEMAEALSPRADIVYAGNQIKRSIRGEGGFVDRFKNQQEQLYNQLDTYIPRQSQVNLSRTLDAIGELNADIPGARAVSTLFKNARIADIGAKLREDIGEAHSLMPGEARGLPYEAVKKLRTLVGRELADNSLVSDVPRSKWKALYASLSNDLGDAAEAAGPDAVKAWSRANQFTSAGLRRLEVLDDTILDRVPEQVFKAATAGTREGASTINTVMKSLPPTTQRVVTATFLKRLGTATPGQQDDTGMRFSTNTFLTNWSKVSPEAKRALFERHGYGDKFINDMNKIARVASNLRDGSKVFANPSGTGGAELQAGTVGGLILALATGQFEVAGGAAGLIGISNALAKTITSPVVTAWLARATQMPVGALSVQPYVLKALADRTGDESAREMALAIEDLKDEHDQQSDQQ